VCIGSAGGVRGNPSSSFLSFPLSLSRGIDVYLVGKPEKDSEYDSYRGLDEIRLFHDLRSAVRFIQENVEVTHYHRDDERMRNPMFEYSRRPNEVYATWRARLRDNPPFIPNPNPKPYDEYYVKSEYVVLAVEPPDLTVTVTTDDSGHVTNSLYVIDDLCITVYPVVVEDDLI
jgi:hypothetical protein